MDIEKVFNANQFSDELFDSVNSSVSELRMLQKKKAGESAQAVIQALQKMKGDLEGKYDDIYAMLENRIARIQDGRDGMDGLNGRNGKDGMPGRDGRDGIDGINGLDGADGISITDIRIDFDNSLIITLSNGREVNAGEILPPDITDRLRVIINSGGGNVPAGSDTQIQYNDNGTFAGSSALTFNGTNLLTTGAVGIGSTALTGYNLRIGKDLTGATTAIGVDITPTIMSDVTVSGTGFRTQLTTEAASFTLGNITHYNSTQLTLGAGSTVTNQYGYIAGATLTGATNNYGFFGNIAAATNSWNFYANGTASNYMAGRLGIGTTSLTDRVLAVGANISGGATSSGTAYGVATNSTIQSDVTVSAQIYRSSPSTQAASFTLTDLYHYTTNQGTIGSGSSITRQYGFIAGSSLVGAGTNYGFYGDIPAATGRYNLYMAGSAANYFAGDMQFNKTVTPSGTNGAQTINKNAGTVNFAAAAASLVVTNSLVTANSIIICTVGTNDTTMKSVQAVAASGSFTLYPNANPTAATRVNFIVIN